MISNTLNVITERGFLQIINGKLIEPKIQLPPTSSQIYFIRRFPNTWYCTWGDGIWVRPALTTLKDKATENEALKNYVVAGTTNHVSYWWNTQRNSILKIVDTTLAPIDMKEMGLLRHVANANDTPIFLFNSGIYKYGKGTKQLYNIFKRKTLILEGVDSSLYRNPASVDSIANLYYKNIRRIHYLNDTNLLLFNHGSTELLVEKDSTLESILLLKERAKGFLNVKTLSRLCIYNSRNIFLFNNNFTRKFHINYDMLRASGINGIIKIEASENGDIYLLSENELFCFRKGKLIKIPTNLNLSAANLFISKSRLVLTGIFGLAIAELHDAGNANFRILLNYKKKLYKNIRDAYVNKDGKIFLSTNSKCYVVDLDSIAADPYLLSAKEKGVSFHLLNRNYQNLKKVDTFLISENGERLILDPIDYLGVDGGQLFFRLNDGEWQKAVNNEIPVGNLKPEKFCCVQYYLQDNFWKNKTNTLYVLQLPKWYQRREWQLIFWLAGILFFAGTIFIASAITRRLVARTNEKRRLRTELELRAIHAQINPHFIFNTLSTALYFISKQQTRNAYEHVSKFSKLLRNYIKSSRERFIVLADEIEMLRQYIELQKVRFNNLFQYEIYVAPDIRPSNILLPSLLLQPLVENAINHGLFNKEGSGYLKIEFYKGRSETELICIIDDNGIGRIKAKELNKRFRREKGSFGTLLTENLIDIFKRYEQMDIELEYIDKAQPDTGTTVRLKINNVKNSSYIKNI